MRIITAAATVVALMLLISAVALASPEKTDKFGCHKCTKDCEKYSLAKGEYHCHGTLSAQSAAIVIAPRIYGNLTYRRVARIIDGDTLTVYIGGKQAVVRLLGIDTPEKSIVGKAECYSSQAANKLAKLASDKFVLLEKDKLQPDKDKYGRLLRYLTLLDNKSISEELLKGGYAKAYPALTTEVEYYKHLEVAARNQKAGMWGECFREKKNENFTRLFPLKEENVKK